MRTLSLNEEVEPIVGTIRQAARRYGLGEKLLRARVAAGDVPLYSAGCARPRVFFSDVEKWLRSTLKEVQK